MNNTVHTRILHFSLQVYRMHASYKHVCEEIPRDFLSAVAARLANAPEKPVDRRILSRMPRRHLAHHTSVHLRRALDAVELAAMVALDGFAWNHSAGAARELF